MKAELSARIEQVQRNVQQAKRELAEQEAFLRELYAEKHGAFAIGSVISWKVGKALAYGRVVRLNADSYAVEYHVVRIKADGQDGEPATAHYNATLVAEKHEAGKVYHIPVVLKRKSSETAALIDAHLNRIEADPQFNPLSEKYGIRDYYNANCRMTGSKIQVTYVGYQGSTTLAPLEAEAYLDWLNAGNVGTHTKCKWES